MTIFKSWKIKKILKKLKSMQANRVHNQPSDELLKKEVAFYFELAELFKKLRGHKKYPHAELMWVECYRAAAGIDNPQAHFELGQYFIEEVKFRQKLMDEEVLNSSQNTARHKQICEEAHAHLLAAEQLGHIGAKRLRGLCYINGWGVKVDKKTGFELVVASIDQEGSWDKIPQIFADMGLNKPEFFSAILQHKKNT